MKSTVLYLIQVIISSGILYMYYHFLLRNKKFHQYNRYFLLLATAISFCIPFFNIPVYFDAEKTTPILVQTLTSLSPGEFGESAIPAHTLVHANWLTSKNILSSVYLLIIIFLFIRFIVALFRIARLVQIYPVEKIDNIYFITTPEPATPFSFFRWLFWNNKIDLHSADGQQILRHELFHIREKHSWDIIFLEMITMLFWINPFFHLIKKEIKAIHEFLADKFAVEENKEWHYAELLLMQVLGSPHTRLTNPFFHNQIKRRIAMLTTSQKPGFQYVRKIMVLPLAAIIASLFAFTYQHKINPGAWSRHRIMIIVDAGHGGNDPGAMSIGQDITEAEITLTMAKQIRALAKEYNITVVMTREDENFPGGVTDKNEALKKRIAMSAEIKPAAFISLHVGATPDKEYQTKNSGIEAYISAKRPDAKGKILASAILQGLAATYKTDLTVKQRNQEGIWILDQNICPTVLLQCGFINNVNDLTFFRNKGNQEKIARNILDAIVKSNSIPETNTDGFFGMVSKDTTPEKEATNKVIPVNPANKSNDPAIAGQSVNKVNEIVVVGHPSQKSNKANAVAGHPLKADEVVVAGYPSKSGKTKFVSGHPIKQVDEVVVVGYPSQKSNQANAVAGHPLKADEVVVAGYPSKSGKTKIVSGHPIKQVDEVVVVGYPSQKSNKANAVTGDPHKADEVVVAGYPSKSGKAKVVSGHPVKKVDEVVVEGYPSKRTATEKVVEGYPIEKKTDTLSLKKLQ